MTNEVASLLRAARARIAQPEHWCKGTLAQNRQGDSVFELDEEAVRWCVVGALFADAGPFSSGPVVGAAFARLKHCTPAARPRRRRPTVAEFNDAKGTTHADILALYDCAIARAEAEGGE